MYSTGGGGREIITLQFGGFANYTGAHFWNAQSEQIHRAALSCDSRAATDEEGEHDAQLGVDPRILFKLGEKRTVPRTVLVEYSTALGSLHPLAGGSTELAVEERLWDGAVEKHVAPAHPKSDFLRWLEQGAVSMEEPETFEASKSVGGAEVGGGGAKGEGCGPVQEVFDVESGVKVWSDYSKVHYHERTLQTIHRYGSQQDFDVFSYGAEVLDDEKKMEDIMDALRYFMEECDRIQGFHCLIDVNTGFAGIADRVFQELKDEVGSADIFGFGLTRQGQPGKGAKAAVQQINKAVAASRFATHCSMYIPLEFESFELSSPFVTHYKPQSMFHASAIAGAFVDVLSSPYRSSEWGALTGSGGSNSHGFKHMRDVSQALQKRPSMTVASGSIVLPYTRGEGAAEAKWDAFCEDAYELENSAFFGGLVSYRGADHEGDSLQGVKSAWEKQRPEGSGANIVGTRDGIPISLTFPSVFSNRLDTNGRVLPAGVVSTHPPMDVQALASVEASKKLTLNALHRYYSSFHKRTLRTIYPFTKGSGAFSQDELTEVEEDLEELVQAYMT